MGRENLLQCKALSRWFWMETSARSAWIRLVQGIAAWNIIFWATARLAIWIELAISGLNFITKINRAIKPSELPCAPEEGRRKWFSGDFCWKMDDGSIKISIYMIIRIGWKQRKRCHSQEKP